MKILTHLLVFAFLCLVLSVQGCDVFVTYDVKVINDTDSSFEVYMDDEFQFKLGPGGSSTIRDVDEGTHKLEARVLGVAIAERVVDLDSDIEWTVFVEKHEITVINDTNSRFSVYLDGVYQFGLEAGESGIIKGVAEGLHTLEARIDDFVVADRTVDVDGDIEWTIY